LSCQAADLREGAAKVRHAIADEHIGRDSRSTDADQNIADDGDRQRRATKSDL